MNLNIDFHEKVEKIEVKFEESFSNNSDPYVGEYVITPQKTEQIMNTAGKTMRKDVTVKKVPRYDVSNESGGTTVIIGE